MSKTKKISKTPAAVFKPALTPEPALKLKAALPTSSKLSVIVSLMQKPKGASIAEMVKATGWQTHSVRGAISGAVKKRRGLSVTSEEVNGERRYRVGGSKA